MPKALKNPWIIGGGVLAVALIFLVTNKSGGNATQDSIDQATAANVSYSHDAAAYLMAQGQNASDLAALQIQARTAETVQALTTADHIFSVKAQGDAANYATYAGIVSTANQVNGAVAIAAGANATATQALPYLLAATHDTNKYQFKTAREVSENQANANGFGSSAAGGVIGLIGGLLTNGNFLNAASNVFGSVAGSGTTGKIQKAS